MTWPAGMSCDADGFQLVHRRRGHHRAPPRYPPHRPEVHTCSAVELGERVRTAHNTLQQSLFHQEFIEQLKAHSPPTEVVCYGIGHFGSCPIARMQFALLLVIIEQCKPDLTWVFDPILSEEEVTSLEDYNCTPIPTNELCRRPAKMATLFYMPHCGRALYNNLLWANWSAEQLARTTIIGNSFSSYGERTTRLQLEAPYIHHISSYCSEELLPHSFPDSTVFNDLSLHTFPSHLLQKVPASVWAEHSEPHIDPDDPEIITT